MDFGGDPFEVLPHLFEAAAPEIRVPRNALERRFRVQLERQPRHVDEALLLELVDSDRVDVAPGSNVVGEDDQLDRLDCLRHNLGSPIT